MRLSKEARARRKRFIIFLALSLLVHLFILSGAYKIFPKFYSEKNEREPLVVEIDLPQSPVDQGHQIVNTEKADNNETPDNAKLMGERNQVVEKETKAKSVDVFRQGGGLNQGEKSSQSLSLKSLAPKTHFDAKPLQDSGDTQVAQKQQQQSEQQKSAGSLNSANNDYLKDVKDGDKTLLSTKEFVYFGYYNRIRSKLEQAWNNRLRAVFQDAWISKTGRLAASNQSFYTRVILELDRHGRITSIQVLEASGARELDKAAIDAFNQAGPFPDPPSGLIEKDGKIHIPWGFVVST